MNELALSTIELFAGVGMLGEGLRAGLDYLDIPHRTVCYVEREAHAAAVLVARMEEGSLDEAAVWSDVTTFPARRFRGKVDGIVAGFPCQDISVAGRRKGLDGQRSGLFFEIPRIADDCGAWFLFLENVSGISSATATVMDEAEGELDERAAARVVGELADLGWHAEWIVVSAADVGASHGRARWFCFAWRNVADAESRGRGQRLRDELAGGTEAEGAGESMDDTARNERYGPYREGGSRRGICEAGNELGNAARDGWHQGRAESDWQQGRSDIGGTSLPMAHSESHNGRRELETGSARSGRPGPAGNSGAVADTRSTRLQGPELGRACNSDRGGAENTWIS